MKPFIGILNIPNGISLVGLIASLITVLLALHGHYEAALVSLMYAGLADIYDGLAARKLKSNEYEQLFGSQLDTIIDMASFGVVPLVFFVTLGMNTLFDYIALLLYCCCAAMRLAFFNTMFLQSHGKMSFYTGLPVTYVSWIIPLVMTVATFTSPPIYFAVMRVLVVALAVLFVANIRIPKLLNSFRYVLTILTLVMTVFWFSFSIHR